MPFAGTPRAVAQSALGFGAFSYVIDRMGQQPANAAPMTACSETDGSCKRLVQQVCKHIHAHILALSVTVQKCKPVALILLALWLDAPACGDVYAEMHVVDKSLKIV